MQNLARPQLSCYPKTSSVVELTPSEINSVSGGGTNLTFFLCQVEAEAILLLTNFSIPTTMVVVGFALLHGALCGMSNWAMYEDRDKAWNVGVNKVHDALLMACGLALFSKTLGIKLINRLPD